MSPNCSSSIPARIAVRAALIVLVSLGLISQVAFAAGPIQVQQRPSDPGAPKIWLQDNRPLSVTHVGPAAASMGSAQPLSMVSADFDEDGVQDLVVGYSTPNGGVIAFHRGNLDAFAPQSDASFQAIARNEFPSPFLPEAQTFAVPVRPDFIAAGNFTGLGHTDLAVASRGGDTLYILAGDGKGNFGTPQTFNLLGAVDSLAAGSLGSAQHVTNLLVSVRNPQGKSYLLVFGGGNQAFTPLAVLPLSAPASSFAFGHLGSSGLDAAFLSGGQVVILQSSSMQLENLSLPVSAVALALGSFLPDRNPGFQIALLASDGSAQIAARNDFDPSPRSPAELAALRATRFDKKPAFAPRVAGWKIVEIVPGVAPFTSPQNVPQFFRIRNSGLSADDLMAVNPSSGQLAMVYHTNLQPGTTTFAPGQVEVRPYAGSPVGVLPMRVNVDGRAGVVLLHQGELVPRVMSPLPDPIFTVNTTSDLLNAGATPCASATPGQCSLRQAIFEANAAAGNDTIMLPAGTYQLTIADTSGDPQNDTQGQLSISDGLTITGAVDGSGNPTSIIQACSSTPSATGTTCPSTGIADAVIAINPLLAKAFDTTLTNLEIRFGMNRGTFTGDGNGAGVNWDANGSANPGAGTLTITNCNIHDNVATNAGGGGLALSNASTVTGSLITISNSTISNNVSHRSGANSGLGGGMFLGPDTSMVISNTKFLNNSVNDTNSVGGGMALQPPTGGQPAPTNTIHASTFSGNHAAQDGGGILTTANMTIDQGTIISNNTAGRNGGGLWSNILNLPAAQHVTLSKVTITGNTATGDGGGIHVDSGASSSGNNLTISFSRLAGNTGATGSNLGNVSGSVTATNNWWGTNTPATTINNGSPAVTFDPFIVLTHTASPNKIRINQSTTLTADMSKDNHGNGAALSGNLDEIVGIPITFNNAVDGSISGAQTSIQSNGTATATFNAGNVAGGGKADAVVDQATVTADIIVLQPPSIAKSFSPTVIKVGGTSTITFSITNPNVVTINSSFADDLTSGGTVTGLVVATPPNVVNGCGGSVTANAGATSISFLNAALPVSGSPCTITVNVTGTTDGIKPNSVTIDSTDAGNGNTASASPSLTVINPPTINKVFGATSIPLNGTSSLTFTITNPNSNAASVLNGVSFTDTLPNAAPGTLVVANPSGLTNTCSTAPTATPGSGAITLTGSSLAAGASCTISVNVQGTVAGLAPNSVTVSDTVAGTGNTSSTSLLVVAPPTISKSFSPKSVPLNSNSTLSFTLTNPNTGSALSGVAFTDTLPSGVKLASTTVTGSCGSGTITATINNPPGSPSTVSLSGGTFTASPAAGSSCTFSVSVTGISAGAQVNTTSTVSSTEGGTGGTASDTLTVVTPPTISKSFSPKSVPLNSNSTLSFTVTNPNTASALSGVAFTDSLPAGTKLASTTVTGSCGSGTITATVNNPPGSPSTVSLSGGTLTASPAAGSSCTFSVSVTGISAGAQVNTTGTVSSTEGGTGGTATDTLTVIAPPTISKSFSPKSVPLNGNSTLSFTLTNPNTVSALSGVAFTDSLPTGLKLASTTVTGSCGSGTITATVNNPPGSPSTVSLSGGTLTASPDPASSCTFSVSVTGISAGPQVNTTGTVSSTEGGTGGTATDTLTVIAPPTISKHFGHTTVPLNQSDTLSFTLTNPNTTSALSGVAFTDTLPGGLKLSSTTVTGSCGSGTITATINNPPGSPSTVSLSGGTLTASPAAGSSCTFSVGITGITAGAQVNTTSTVSSTEGGTGGTATDTITVVAPPTTAKVFNPTTISVGGTSTMTITITNPSATAGLTGVGFTDTFPANLVVANPNGLSNTCNGTPSAVAGSGTVSLTGGTIAANSSCTVTVNVTSSVSGTYLNSTGPISSTEGGNGAAASATLTVASPPTSTKAFTLHQIPLSGTTTLTINITNPNTNVAFTGVAFTDSLPAGLQVAPTPNGTNTCGGTFNPAAGAGSVSLSGGTLASSASCAVSVSVQGTTAGVKVNSVTVTSTEGGAGTPSSDTITVVGPPTVQKSFGAPSVALNVGTTSMGFQVTNPNTTVGLSGIGFTDSVPAGLQLTSTTVTGSCGSGIITAVIGPPSSVTLSGGTLAASGSCTFSVTVKGIAAGAQNNTTGQVISVEGGTGATSNTATLNVDGPPTIAKAFNPAGIQPNGVSTLTITITNPAANPDAAAGVAFTDNFPANLVVATPNGLTNTCGGTPTATAGTGSVSLSGGSIPVNSSCTVTVNVTATPTGSYLNSTGPVSSTNGGTGGSASATLFVANPPTISKLFVPSSTVQGGTSLVSFTINNNNSNSTPPNSDVTLTGISFTDVLPAGLQVAASPNVSNDCGGTLTANPGSNTITLTGGSLGPAIPLIPGRRTASVGRLLPSPPAANGACFISVKVQATATGTLNNTTGPISANESGPGAPSNTATLTVAPPPNPPTVNKAFGAATIQFGATTSLTFNIANPNASTTFDSISLNDPLPAGLAVASPNGLSGTCVTSDEGSVTATPGAQSISLTGLSLAGNGSCSFTVNVTGVGVGVQNNTTGNITATFNDGTGTFVPITGGTASASVTVVAPIFAITKTHTGNFSQRQVGANYTITVSNTGNAPTVGTVTVTENPPAGLVVTGFSGTNWSCNVGQKTCTRSDSLNPGSSYDVLTLRVNVSPNAPALVTNSVTVSGGGAPSPATATDPTTVIKVGPPIKITADPTTTTVTTAAGFSATFNFTVDQSQINPPATVITFSCSGLPVGTACAFSPLGEAQPVMQVTMTVTTLGRNNSSAALPFGTGRPPIYAVLMFSMFGLAGISLVGLRGKKTRLRLTLAFAGLMVFLALSGCGGNPLVTPPGMFPITVTGTADTGTGTATGSTTVNLHVL